MRYKVELVRHCWDESDNTGAIRQGLALARVTSCRASFLHLGLCLASPAFPNLTSLRGSADQRILLCQPEKSEPIWLENILMEGHVRLARRAVSRAASRASQPAG